MRKLLFGSLCAFVAFSSTGAVAQSLSSVGVSSGDIQRFCTSVWLDGDQPDRRMYSACQQEQQQALLRLRGLSSRYSGQDFFNGIAISHCREAQGQGEALNLVQFSFCLDDEVEGYRDIQYLRRLYGARRVDSETRNALGASGSWAAAAGLVKRNAGLKLIRRGGTS